MTKLTASEDFALATPAQIAADIAQGRIDAGLPTYEIEVLEYKIDTNIPDLWTVFVDGKEHFDLVFATVGEAQDWIARQP